MTVSSTSILTTSVFFLPPKEREKEKNTAFHHIRINVCHKTLILSMGTNTSASLPADQVELICDETGWICSKLDVDIFVWF